MDKRTHLFDENEATATRCGDWCATKHIRKRLERVTCRKCRRLASEHRAVTKRIVWFARGGGVARVGPFDSQVEATNAIRLAPRRRQTTVDVLLQRSCSDSNELFPADAFVWPEEVPTE